MRSLFWFVNYKFHDYSELTLFLQLNVNDFECYGPNDSQQFWIIMIMHEGVLCDTKNWSSGDLAFAEMIAVAPVSHFYIPAICFQVIQVKSLFLAKQKLNIVSEISAMWI